jgi:hypothetical protein
VALTKTPNIVIQIITAESQEALLLGGEIDILDSTTLVGLTETLVAAEAEGKIKTIVQPSATWEHIDIALFVRSSLSNVGVRKRTYLLHLKVFLGYNRQEAYMFRIDYQKVGVHP